MTGLRVFFQRLLGLFQRRKLERELEEEIRSHLEMQIEDNLRQGMSVEDARRAARLRFGGVEQVKEAYRDKSRLGWIESLWQDLRYGVRTLMKSPGFAFVAVLSLALGIGANTALFSVVDAVLLKTLPVPEPERLALFEWHAGLPFRVNGMSGTNILDLPPGIKGGSLFRYEVFEKMRQAHAAAPDSPLSDFFAFAPINEVAAVVGDQAEIVNGQVVSGGYYAGLRVQPILGRAITDEDDKPGAAPVVVLSYQFWQERFGANPAVIGQTAQTQQAVFHHHRRDAARVHRARCRWIIHPAVTVPIACEPLLRGETQQFGHGERAGRLVAGFDGAAQTGRDL